MMYRASILDHKSNQYKTILRMEVLDGPVNTFELPSTVNVLKNMLPAIFFSKCFNEKSLPFSEEVKATEVGHLFEHILLECLYERKSKLGYANCVHSGVTKWNWKKDLYGVFEITINIGINEKNILSQSIDFAAIIMENIYNENYVAKVSRQIDAFSYK